MVSIEQTAKKYRGRKASTYDAIRTKQQRWDLENAAVTRMLSVIRPKSVLDCPVGTGRFLKMYADIGVRSVQGVDVSSEMLALAHRKKPRSITVELEKGDATNIDCDDRSVDVAVCVRFLDLIDENAMRLVMSELMRVSKRAIVLTIRLGDEYVPKVNTATHHRKKFLSVVSKHGWRVEETVPIFLAGWVVMRLGLP